MQHQQSISSRKALILIPLWLASAGCPGHYSGGIPGGGTDLAVSADGGGELGTLQSSNPDLSAADAAPSGPPCATLPGTPESISGHISADTTLSCDHLYLMNGIVVVDNNATLTIAKGTIIMMATDGSLIITPGSKIFAVGTADQPILFTSAYLPGSRNPGDWGTVALVGKAPGNWGSDGHGGSITQQAPDANEWPGGFPYMAGGGSYDDSSGTLKYVRLEYGGRPRNGIACTQTGAAPLCDHEMLGMYGVGSGTTISYIDMRQANFGCIFAEGGAFYAHHLVCQWSGNGGFLFTRGNKSHAQFLFSQEGPTQAAEGVGIKGPFDNNPAPPTTDPLLYNVTACGTNGSPATVKDPWGLYMKREPGGKIYNMIAAGFHAGLAMQSGRVINGVTQLASTELHSSILFGNFTYQGINTNVYDPSVSNDTDMTAWFTNPAWKNSNADPGLGMPGCFDPLTIRAQPPSAITANAATPPDDGFFDPSASFIGAFRDRSDNWASGAWVVWSKGGD
jgi:hypothetical protein